MKWYWKFILTVVFVFLSCAGVLYLMLPETQDGVYKEAVSEEGYSDEAYDEDADDDTYEEEDYVDEQSDVPMDGPTLHQKIRWDVLAELNFKSGKSSENLDKILGKKIRIPGFVVPLEISDRLTQTFLLVPTAGACYHVPPPPPNQMIYVKLTNGGVPAQEKRAPIWVYGVLKTSKQKTKWGNVGFELLGEETHPFKGGY